VVSDVTAMKHCHSAPLDQWFITLVVILFDTLWWLWYYL